jgi:ABC-type dipeptide/oligopeptide/nickel transport system permease subunit
MSEPARRSPRWLVALSALAPLVAVVLAAIVALATRDASPTRLFPDAAYLPPSSAHPLGCGEGGVDLFALLASASLRALALAVLVALFGFALGTPLGALAAMRRGALESAVGKACDALQAFPTFLFALTVLSAVRHPNRVHLALVFAATAWAPFARLALAEARVLRGAGFVEAARALGLGETRILFRHVVPNLLGTVAVQIGSSASAVVLSEASLSFVGFGPADGVSLGAALDQGVSAMLRAPHVLVATALTVFVTSTALLVAGRALGPRKRRS